MSQSKLLMRVGAIRALIESIEDAPAPACMREGLTETPERTANAWEEWTSGYKTDPATLLKTFEDGAKNYNQIVLVRSIPVYSMCEHHLAPFFGRAHVAYLPNSRIVGLSKFPRVVDAFARRLQVQERLTQQIAECINNTLKPKGVGVILECRHLCMESRGVNMREVWTVTSALLGAFQEGKVRDEFLQLTRGVMS